MASSSGKEPSVTHALVGATSNLFISAAGAGLLSYPFAVMQQGIVLNVLFTVAFALINAYTDCVLATVAHKHAARLKMRTYEELCLRDLGPRMYAFAVFSVIVGCVGSLIGFLVIIGDMATDVVSDICTRDPSAACTALSSRAFLVIAFAVLIALPLSSCDRIHHMWGSSLLAAVTVLAVGALVIRRGADAIMHPDVLAPANSSMLLTDTFLGDTSAVDACSTTNGPLYLFRWHVPLILGVPISIFSLGNHIQAVVVFSELPRKAQQLWHRVVISSVGCCLVLYLCTGIFGYVACREGTAGDVLNNFPASDPLADAAKALMAIHIAMAIPVIVLPCRRAFLLLWHMFKLRRARSSAVNGDSARLLPDSSTGAAWTSEAELTQPQGAQIAAEGDANNGSVDIAALVSAMEEHEAGMTTILGVKCSRGLALQNATMILVAAAVAIVFPQVQVVFGLLGATVAVSQIHFFPGLMLWKEAADQEHKLKHTAHGHQEDVELLSTPSHVYGSRAEPDIRYIPRSPFWLRIQAVFLLTISVIVAFIGTGTYIWQSFIER